jgi:drug/metabolite transporter (DMT)-like permease
MIFNNMRTMNATTGMGIGALGCAPFDGGFSVVPTWPAHGWLAALATVTQIGGWLCIAGALPRLPALETSILLVGQPVLSVVWGVWLFGERLSLVQWTGSALVLVGVAALSARGAVQPPVENRGC